MNGEAKYMFMISNHVRSANIEKRNAISWSLAFCSCNCHTSKHPKGQAGHTTTQSTRRQKLAFVFVEIPTQ